MTSSAVAPPPAAAPRPAGPAPAWRGGVPRRWLTPSLADCLYVALVFWLIAFSVGDSGAGLLNDANTGFHVRVGEWILEHHAVPQRDFLSFTRPDQPWFMWEWLASIGIAAIYHLAGLKGLILVSAYLIALAMLVLVRHMAARGANVLIIVFLVHLGIGASSVHYLARPHILTLLFLAVSLWMLEADRRRPGRRVWLLVPLTALWVNLHGAFAALLVSLGVLAVGAAAQAWLEPGKRITERRQAWRYATLAALCLGASLLNPYGFREHLHILAYMRQSWVVKAVEEFQSPDFHSLHGHYFELLWIGGVMLAVRLLARREIGTALLLLVWAHLALVSVRHVPLYVIVLLPPAASELAALWRVWIARQPPRSTAAVLDRVVSDHNAGMRRSSLLALVLVALPAVVPLGIRFPTDFPEPRFPVSMVTRHAALLASSRVFSTDMWGDYLTYRLYPRQRVFIDGRCDFFGEKHSSDYMQALNGLRGWRDPLEAYRVDVVLVPSESALASLLRQDAHWTLVEENPAAALFRLAPGPAPLPPPATPKEGAAQP